MDSPCEPINVLVAEADPEDRLLAAEFLGRVKWVASVHFVSNGQELFDYLHRRNYYARQPDHCRPDLILLELDLPGKRGLQALREIRDDSALASIPVVLLAEPGRESVLRQARDLGVQSHMTKPLTADQGNMDLIAAHARARHDLERRIAEHLENDRR